MLNLLEETVLTNSFFPLIKGISLVDESSDLREDEKLQELTTGLQYAYTKPAVSLIA